MGIVCVELAAALKLMRPVQWKALRCSRWLKTAPAPLPGVFCRHFPGNTSGLGRRVASTSAAAGQDPIGPSKQALLRSLAEVVEREDYYAAAELKEQLHNLEAQDPIPRLRGELRLAIQEERYQVAAELRDLLKQLEGARVQTSSDTITAGVRVCAKSYYAPSIIGSSVDQFIFAYVIRISNESEKPVQLRSRYWLITDANGVQREVRGPGVVGKQPILANGESFQYQSSCPLSTSYGTMEGAYQMVVVCEGQPQAEFDVAVGKFALDSEGDVFVQSYE